MGVNFDITERKQAEETVVAAQRQVQSIIDNTTAIIYAFDLKERFLLANIALAVLLNSTPEKMIGKRRRDFMPREDADWHEANDRQVIETGKALEFEEYSRLPDHSITWLTTKFPLRDGQGRIYAVGGISTDVTKRKEVEDALRGSEGRFRALTETSPLAIGVSSSDGKFLYINKAYEELFGYSQKELNHLNASELWCNPEGRRKMIDLVKSKGFLMDYEVELKRKDGTPLWAMLSVNPVDYGGNQAIMASVYDVTSRNRAELALKEQAAQLENANKELESFSYSVSHDLKAPLRAIEGYSRMLLKKDADNLSEDTRRKLDVIHSNTKKMNVLIDDLLSFSKVVKGNIAISEINMVKLAREAWAEIHATNTDRELELKISNMLPGKGDPALIRQVLFNLLSNAVKFTKTRKPGIIELTSYSDNGNVVYCIKDNGVGFDMAYYDKLFGVFQRLHSHEEYEGTGVGLAIIHRIINRHGGRVWAEGEVDKGATFFFTLPI